ncbi:hypothetical protein [Ottowia sp.]|uniref:hypothetical protein n=1 Tax=Ottowia sp. TaxID=1898956 RepID=UPI003A84ACCC
MAQVSQPTGKTGKRHRLAWQVLGGVVLSSVAGCAGVHYTPVLVYHCPQQLDFEARLYQDMALLEGARGHAVLSRQPPAPGEAEHSPRYADATVRAVFGLGFDQRLARLDYTDIPEPVYCQRTVGDAEQPLPPVRASWERGPRPPAPFDPSAPVQTNVRTDHGPVRVGH